MNITKTIKSIFLSSLLILPGLSMAQNKVSYKVVDDTPYSDILDIEINAIDMMTGGGIDGVAGGPSLRVQFRPINPLHLDAKAGSFLYLRENGLTGIKKSGGLMLTGGAAFIWSRKGKNMVYTKGGDDYVKTRVTLSASGNVEKYIMIPANRMVERSLRAGGYYHNFPKSEGVSTVTGGYAGIAKSVYHSITIKPENSKEKTSHMKATYYWDVLFGTSDYFVPEDAPDNPIGLRFGFEIMSKSGFFPVSTGIELGSMPGVGGFVQLKIGGNITSGKHKYEGDYKKVRKRPGKLGALIQAVF